MFRWRTSRKRPARRWGSAIAIVLVGTLLTFSIVPLPEWWPSSGTGQDSDAVTERPTSAKVTEKPRRADLVVWSIDGNREGIALALNALRNSPNRTIDLWDADGKLSDLYSIVRDLIDEKYRPEMPSFTLRISEPATGATLRNQTIRFAFARPNSLTAAWRPLYESVAAGEPLAALKSRYGGASGGWIGGSDQWGEPDLSPPDPDWLANLSWKDDLLNDLKQFSQSPVVLLGPDSSDEVPALWFLLAILTRDHPDAALPPMICTDATWPVLGQLSTVSCQQGAPAPDGPASRVLTSWVSTLGRALGFSADKEHFRFASADKKRDMDAVTCICREIAGYFIQYARPDDRLVADIHRELVDVRGYRRIAILYRDSLEPRSGAHSPELARRLYGPALSDLFRNKNEASSRAIYLDSPFPKAPAREDDPITYPRRFADWEGQARDVLGPILRFFEREEVEAVGVFGNAADEKSSILKFVHQRLPAVQIFTSEPDWRLESPDPPTVLTTGHADHATSNASDFSGYPLNGLMVFSGPIPPIAFIRNGFQDLNEVALVTGQGQPFLPSIFTYYTSNVVRHLIELPLDRSSYQALKATTRRQETIHNALVKLLRESPTIRDRLQIAPARSSFGQERGVLMLLSDGRLHSITEPRWAEGMWVTGLIPVALVLGFYWFLRSPTPTRREPKAHAETLWAWFFQDRTRNPTTPANDPGAREADQEDTPNSTTPPPPRPDVAGVQDQPESPRDDTSTFGSLLAGRRRITIAVFLVLLILPSVTTGIDIHLLANQVSPSIIPDAHSILPSLYLFLLITVLALWQPEAFLREISGPGRSRLAANQEGDDPTWGLRCFDLSEENLVAEESFDQSFLAWRRHDVIAHLWPGRNVTTDSLGLAIILTLIDAVAGYPLPFGFTKFLVMIYEAMTLWAVITSSLIFRDMARAVHRLPRIFEADPESSDRHLSLMDPEAVRRLGTIFIGVVANGLLIYTLLLISRLPWLGFPRWRWDVVVLGWDIPLGLILFAVSLFIILGYWYYCFRTFQRLIQRIKDAKLRQLTTKRKNRPVIEPRVALASPESVPVPPSPAPEPTSPRLSPPVPARKETETGEELEKRRREILSIPENPWSPGGAWKARVALLVAALTPTISAIFGPWSSVIVNTLRTWFGS